MSSKRSKSDRHLHSAAKRCRHVLSIEEKVRLLDLLEKERKSVSEVARLYGKNESSIREISKNSEKIRSYFSTNPHASKTISRPRNIVLGKVEKELHAWIEDVSRMGFPMNGRVFRQKALSLYEEYRSETDDETKTFSASNGWFTRFKKRYNVKMADEPAPSDETEAASFVGEFKRIIDEGGYHPKQVFNCDEAALFWKKLPDRTYEQRFAGVKDFQDRLTLVLCGNAEGYMIKPGVVYKTRNPSSLKHKKKSSLPVFWQHNTQAWVTVEIFQEWFNCCFVPEVKKYLLQEGFPFKVLLIMDNAPGHPLSMSTENENVQVVFLPAGVASLLQPLEQGVFQFIKATYTRRVFEMILESIYTDPETSAIECWESFNIANAIILIRSAVNDLEARAVNFCWKPLWAKMVKNGEGPPTIEQVERIKTLARKIGGDGFRDLDTEDLLNFLNEDNLNITNVDLIQPTAEEGDDDEEDISDWSAEKYLEVFRLAQNLKNKVLKYDPDMDESMKVTGLISDAMSILHQNFDKLKPQLEV